MTTLTRSCFFFSSPQDGVKFVSIGALFSELVAISSKGELYQWKWSEPEPYRNTQVGKLYFMVRKHLQLTDASPT